MPDARRSKTSQQEPLPKEPWVTIHDVATHLGVAPATVRYWLHIGTAPPSCKVGRHVRFRLSEVDRWMETRRS